MHQQLVLCDVTHFDTYMYIYMYIFQYIYTYDMLNKNKSINQGSEIQVNSPVFWVGVVGVGYPGWVPGALKISMEPKKPPNFPGKSSSIFDPSTNFCFSQDFNGLGFLLVDSNYPIVYGDDL